jgi:anti-sigma factor RsiW
VSERPISEDDLHAFVDRSLDPDREAVVRRYLDAHPDAARRVSDYASQRQALRQALAPIAEEPIPSRLNLDRLLAERRKPQRRSWPIAAACAFLAVGTAGGWVARGFDLPAQAGVSSLGQEAADNYRVYAADRFYPVEFKAQDRDTLSQWISARLNRPVSPPDLTSVGYRLMGGRLVATPHGPAGLFLYSRPDGQRLEVFMRPMRVEQNARMREHAYGALGGVAWSDDGLGYSLIGAAPSNELHPLADEVRRQVRSLGA